MNQQQMLASLLQPALIRLIDQLRQQLADSPWQWNYETHEIWPEAVSQTQRDRYNLLQAALETASDDEAVDLETELAMMPMPIPIYRLNMSQGDRQEQLNMWELCYQICLLQYAPILDSDSLVPPSLETYPLDAKLLDSTGEIDWPFLDQKAECVVSQMLETLN